MPPLGPPSGIGPRSRDDDSGEAKGQSARPTTPSPDQSRQAEPLRPGRPLLGGGPFTLAVAFGLQADQQAQTVTAGSADNPAQAAEVAAQASSSQEGTGPNQLSEEEQKVVRELQQRDQEVRRHEAAHASAGGALAGSPTFTYQRGPDGRQYAVGGSVSIDTSPVKGDPEATLQKARQIRSAALAPADPSGQDKSVAAAASALERQAQAEIAAERRAEQNGEGEEGTAEPAVDSQTVDTTPELNGAAPAEGPAGAGTEQSGETSGLGAASGSSLQGESAPISGSRDEAEVDDTPAGPRQSSPFNFGGLENRASTGFDNRTPAPQIISIAV